MANQNVFFVPATSLVTASVTLQTAAHGAVTYADNVYFMGVGGNVVSLKRPLEILDYLEWLCSIAQAEIDTAGFPRPAAGHLTALETQMIAAHEGWKHQFTLVTGTTGSDPFSSDDSIFFGYTGHAVLTPPQFGVGVQMGSNGLDVAFQAMKKFSLIGTSIWT